MGLVRRGGIYYLRRRKPGGGEIKVSLRTGDRKEALRRYHLQEVALQAPDWTPKQPAVPKSAATLDDLRTLWLQQAQPAAGSVRVVDQAVSLWRALGLPDDVGEIDTKTFRRFRDAQIDAGRATNTIRRNVGMLGALFGCAAENEAHGVTANPASRVRVRAGLGAQRVRRLFTLDEVRVLRDTLDGAWLIIFDLGLFAGLRIGEAAGLHAEDIQRADGIDFLAIGRNLKTEASRRRVPVHPRALAGLLGWVEGRTGALFDTPSRRSGKFTLLCQARGIEGVTFHSLRHGFAHEGRRAGLPEDHVDALMGHQTATIARSYGSPGGFPLGALAASIVRMWPDL